MPSSSSAQRSLDELSSRQLFLRLLRHVRPYWRHFSLAILAMVVGAATEPALPALMKPLLDGSFVHKDPALMRLIPVLLVLVFLVRGAASFISTMGLAWVAGKVVMDLRVLMFDKLLSLPIGYYDHSIAGTLVSKVTFDVTQLAEAATFTITVLIRDSLAILGLLVWMVYLSWELSLVVLLVGPVVVHIVRLISKRLRTMSRSWQRTMGELTAVLEQTLRGQKVVRIFGGQAYEQRRFAGTANWVRRYQMKFISASAANAPVVQLVTAVGMAGIIYLATERSASDQMSVGEFVSFFTAMGMLFSPLKRLTGVNGPLQRGLAAAGSIFQLADEPSEADPGIVVLDRALGRVDFRDVTFRYVPDQKAVLNHVSFSVSPGETLALVGASGSGKSTLVNLIPRFYHPSAGRILLDGHDLEDLRLANLRRNIALVSQDVVLFNDTIAANIAYGRLAESSPVAIAEAAAAAHAMEFIQGLPDGLETLVGENGVRLSGGQRQRLAIARAFLKDAPILILDEATASLDSGSEKFIHQALEQLRLGRTTIVIAHRLSTVENADRILVLAEGRVVEEGDHGSLLRRDGVYAGLYRMQFAPDATGGAS